MKKFTTLICLMLCVIVGAVYANWVYASEAVEDATSAVTVSVATKNNDVSGTITASGSPAFAIDQATESYTAKLNWSSKMLTIAFEANAAAPESVKDGVTLKVEFAVSEGLDDAIIANNFTVTLNEGNGWDEEVDLSVDKITVNSGFALPTIGDYEAFESLTKSIAITISMVEGS